MSEDHALQIFLKSPVTQDMIHHLVTVTLQVLPCESSKTITQQLPSPPNSPPILKTKPLPSLMTFITKLVRYTNVYTGTLMSTIVLLNRLKTKLPRDAQGLPCTRHRIFLACLIISSKFHNDSSPKNKHWSKYTDGLFRKEDVNLMERQLLMLLDWDLRIETDELMKVWKRFLDPIKADLKRQHKIRNSLAKATVAVASSSRPLLRKTPSSYSIPSITTTASTTPQLACSRSSSISSLDSLATNTTLDSIHSRASSVSTHGNIVNTKPQQYQQPSIVNVNDYSLNQLIDSVALREEQELSNLMRQYCGQA
ncbi:hypothetical protein CANARDRAFT_194986 [[Candida] arabinofermentans NRRL YB-2248]|uniref:Cyclin-like domain-containing protein n=1 Tax=[Candida] arabinofermentans NRRL YB-2248 TaxID=983967 RepID=A0A1E4T6I5_9ASCO|nr:hypothetical protein CANARDRAFT_194986 [[Candida] arabinofermentans NRRL YB-2248]